MCIRDSPKVETPKKEAPKTEAPKAETPKKEAPEAISDKAEEMCIRDSVRGVNRGIPIYRDNISLESLFTSTKYCIFLNSSLRSKVEMCIRDSSTSATLSAASLFSLSFSQHFSPNSSMILKS